MFKITRDISFSNFTTNLSKLTPFDISVGFEKLSFIIRLYVSLFHVVLIGLILMFSLFSIEKVKF